MTRATNGILSALCLGSGAWMVAYALTAEFGPSSPETVTLTMRGGGPFVERPIEIRTPQAEVIQPFRIALAPRRDRR